MNWLNEVVSLDSKFRDPELLKAHQNLFAEKYSGAMSGSVSLMGYISYSLQVSKPELEKLFPIYLFRPLSTNDQHFKTTSSRENSKKQSLHVGVALVLRTSRLSDHPPILILRNVSRIELDWWLMLLSATAPTNQLWSATYILSLAVMCTFYCHVAWM